MSGEIVDLTSDSETQTKTPLPKEVKDSVILPPNKVPKTSDGQFQFLSSLQNLPARSNMGFSSNFISIYCESKRITPSLLASSEFRGTSVNASPQLSIHNGNQTLVSSPKKELDLKRKFQTPAQHLSNQTVQTNSLSNTGLLFSLAHNITPRTLLPNVNSSKSSDDRKMVSSSIKSASFEISSSKPHPKLKNFSVNGLGSESGKSDFIFKGKSLSKKTSRAASEDFDSSERVVIDKKVHVILAKKKLRRKTFYQVKWVSEKEEDLSWVSPEQLPDKSFIEAFEESIFKHSFLSKWTSIDFDGSEVIRLPSNISNFIKLLSVDDGPVISVFNEIDEAGPPENFICIKKSIYRENIVEPPPNMKGCLCEASCEKYAEKCSCRQHQESISAIPAYSGTGLLKLFSNQGIYECNSNCLCPETCRNRVVQRGRQIKLQVFRTLKKGWGVRTLHRLPKGTFITEYVGEIITTDEAEIRGVKYDQRQSTYLFDLDFEHGINEDCLYTIDACSYGNVSHFFNHSCEPNMSVFSVFVDSYNPHLFRLGFFTTKAVDAYDELCFDYSPQSIDQDGSSPGASNEDPDVNRTQYTCHCGSRKCRGIFLTGKTS